MLRIRHEMASDREAIFRVVAEAFDRELEARLVDALRAGGHILLSLVAEDDGEVVGQALFSPMTVESAGGVWDMVCLGPIAVAPDRQKQGIGGILIEAGLSELRASGGRAVCLLGHTTYYPRFGFRPARQFGLHYEDDRDSFMAIELYPGALDGVSGDVRFAPEFSEVA